MRLWTFREEREAEVSPGLDMMGPRAWRKVLSVGPLGWRFLFGIWLDTEMTYEHAPDPDAWRDTGTGYRHAWVGPWVWGETHDYYDGPHCGRHFGFIHFGWSTKWCLKCMPE